MALDADPGVEAVASQPMWLHWVSESGKARRHAPDFFVRRADGSGVLIDVRPDNRVSDPDSAVFAATAMMAGQAGWAYARLGELPAVRAANLRWLAGYRHPRYARAAVMADLAEVFAEPGPLRPGGPRWATRWRCCRCCSPCCGAAGWPPIWIPGCWIQPRRCGPPGGAGADDPASGAVSRRHNPAGRRHAHGGWAGWRHGAAGRRDRGGHRGAHRRAAGQSRPGAGHRLPGADGAAAGAGTLARGDGGDRALVGAAPDRGDHRGARRTARRAPSPARNTTRRDGRCVSGSWPSTAS
jgi:hypothetical protein